MLDIQFIRDNQEIVAKAAKDKGGEVDLPALLKADDQRRELIGKVEEVRAARNEQASQLKAGRPTPEQIAHGRELKGQIAELEVELDTAEATLKELIKSVPNVPTEDTPIGSKEEDNVILRAVGDKPEFDFRPKAHWEMTGYIEQERAAKISGARFAYIKGGMAQMQIALANWGMLQLSNEDILKEIAESAGLDVSTKPFLPMIPPMMMRTAAYQATARLKPDEITFKLANDDLWLTGSSEHSMCAYYMNDTIPTEELPVRFAGYNSAFRREVGSAGQDTRGILRVHHFNKLEMESFTKPEDSRKEHEFMIAIQEYLMQQLGLPYQVMLKCTADMGGPNARGVDIETWMPGQDAYRETHSADLMTDYQARSLNTKFKNDEGKRELVHTNDATAIADRTLIAIMENYQQEDGSVRVPVVLQPFMGGKQAI